MPRAGSLRLPIGSQSRREDGGYIQTGLGGERPHRLARDPAVPGRTCSRRAQARSPRAFETIGIHLNIALGLSNEVGPPHLIIIENPEAHIHPAGQTSLAELAARASAGGSQVILETHSDHVLNGVRLAVAEGILTSDQVVIHYFERDGLDVRMTSPVLTDSGRLDVWPEGFFDQHERNLSPLAPFNGS